MRLDRLVRIIAVVGRVPLLLWLGSLIIPGGKVRVSGDGIGEVSGMSEVMVRESVWLALIPLHQY